MLNEIISLSGFSSPSLSSSMDNVEWKQITKTMEGGFSLNFSHSLSAIEDFKVKNYTNFYLGANYSLSNGIVPVKKRFSTNKISTTLKMGDLYWIVTPLINNSVIKSKGSQGALNYKLVNFSEEGDIFEISFKENNVCNLFHNDDSGNRYILTSDVNNKLFFIKNSLKASSLSSSPSHDFKYMYGEDRKFIYLYQKNANGSFYLKKSGNTIGLETSGDNISTLSGKIQINRKLSYEPFLKIDSNYVKYDAGNTIDELVDENLSNNLLIHKKISKKSNYTDFLILKNQFSETGSTIQGNNLLSGDSSLMQYTENRDYSSIFEDIPQENSDTLELNYVFYNKDYRISSGSNNFVAPSSMEPFSKINVNDTKFINCGAFSYITPEYSDKIYQKNADEIGDNGQSLLCTWLSGSPNSDDKIWVDRYYYPDLVEKKDAISSNPLFNVTYNDYIEDLMTTNSDLSSSVVKNKIFDKKSDLVFEPNKEYIYQRIDSVDFDSLSTVEDECSQKNISNFVDYESINLRGQYTISFYFKDNSDEWVLATEDDGYTNLTVEKTKNLITFSYKLFDPSNDKLYSMEIDSKFKKNKKNFVLISFDSVKGEFYVFLNESLVVKKEYPVVQFNNKEILNSDLRFNGGDLNSNNILEKVRILDTHTIQELAFITPILDGTQKINDIVITLPSGMRNNTDEINLIHSICKSEAFKSNSVNLYLKNMEIGNMDIVEELKTEIFNRVDDFLPVNTKINKVDIVNYG